MSERLIVIGASAAGISAATTAKHADPELSVTVFSEFADTAYSPCGIPYVHGREIKEFAPLFLSSVQRYVDDGFDMRMETTVTGIDLDRGTVTARHDHVGFDKLILATGFEWEQPDVPGANLDGLHYVKDIRQAIEFDKQIDTFKRAVVIGGQWLGVEMAGALARRGVHVEFIDDGPWLLSELVDPDVAGAAQEALEKLGVSVRMGTALEGFTGTDGHIRAVATSAGELECDVAVIALHKLPNAALAKSIGLKLGTTGAVVVDDHMRTSAGRVWAAGDVIEVPHGLTMLPISGLTGSHAYAQGRTAGANAAGQDRAYDPVWIPWGFRAGDHTIGGFSIGETLAEAIGIPYVVAKGVGGSRARYYPGGSRTFVKLLAEPGTLRLIGAQLHGEEGIKERCDFLAFVARRGATLDDIAWMENIYSPPIGALYEPMQIAAQNGLAELAAKRSEKASA